MNYLTLERLTKSYGPKVMFRDLTLHVDKGQKVALVAKNGTGKSTLMRVIMGEELPEGEQGKVIIHKDIRVGFLSQDPQFDPEQTPLDALFSADAPALVALKNYEEALLHTDDIDRLTDAMAKMDEFQAWDTEASMREILFRLGIRQLEQRIGSMSGGQRKRLALAKLLLEQPDFLILDEPTNHLDIEMIEWLEQYLKQPGLTLFLVTHDRYFIDNICDLIYELDRGQLYKYKGNYADFVEKKAIREDVEAATMHHDKKLFKRELDWMRKSPQARSTKAKAREDAFADLEEKVGVKLESGKVQLEIKGQWLGSKILECYNVTKSYGDLKICENFVYKFNRMERVGIVGANGAGKSTLLKMLTAQEKPDSGRVVVGETVVFGYFGQDGLVLDQDKRVIQVVQDIGDFIPLEKGRKITASQLLERFLFTKEQQQVYASQLSGGERRRLYLLTVLMANPNFLILDEPTNDLDIATLNVLEDFLYDYPGCVIVVTHDRYFLDKVADHLFVFEGDGKIADVNDNYTTYRLNKKQNEPSDKDKKDIVPPVLVHLEQVVVAANPNAPRQKMNNKERREFETIETQLPKLEARRQDILEKFASGNMNGSESQQLTTELGQIQTQLEDMELRWLELSEKEM